jgi:hypothetical protein
MNDLTRSMTALAFAEHHPQHERQTAVLVLRNFSKEGAASLSQLLASYLAACDRGDSPDANMALVARCGDFLAGLGDLAATLESLQRRIPDSREA